MKKLAVLLLIASAAVAQQPRTIDATKSNITVHVFKTGVFSFAGHDHTITAPIASGAVDEQTQSVELSVRVADMKVVDPGESEKNREEIRTTMLSDKVLDATASPTISFQSKRVTANGDHFEVAGALTVHGVSRDVEVQVKRDGQRYVGTTRIKQTDFRIKPVAVAGGTVKVKDEVDIEFSVALK